MPVDVTKVAGICNSSGFVRIFSS